MVVEVTEMIVVLVVVVMVLWVTEVIVLTFRVNTPFVSKIVPPKQLTKVEMSIIRLKDQICHLKHPKRVILPLIF